MTMPNFLLIGAMKAGTTALHYGLIQHPEIFMSPVKEPHFFIYDGVAKDTVIFDYEKKVKISDYPTIITNINEYKNLFSSVRNKKAIGEATQYLHSGLTVATRIYKYIPDVKLIIILRNPVDRAYSHFLHNSMKGREKRNFETAVNDGDYRQGYYYQYLSEYFTVFTREQFSIHLYEDFKENPDKLYKDIFRFLNVNIDFVPKLDKLWTSKTGEPKSKFIHNLFMAPNLLRKVVKKVIPQYLHSRVRSSMFNMNIIRPPIPEKAKTKLTNDFREDVLKLQDLIRRDVSHWLY